MGASEIRIGSLLTKNEFRELTASNDRIAYSHLALRIGIHSGLLFAMVRAWEGGYPALAFAAFYLNAVLWQFAGYAGIGHELFHKKVFSRKWLNTLFFKLFSYVTWNNPSYFEKAISSTTLPLSMRMTAKSIAIFRSTCWAQRVSSCLIIKAFADGSSMHSATPSATKRISARAFD